MKYAIVEKKNHLAVHGLFDVKERAENHLKNIIPVRNWLTSAARPHKVEWIDFLKQMEELERE